MNPSDKPNSSDKPQSSEQQQDNVPQNADGYNSESPESGTENVSPPRVQAVGTGAGAGGSSGGEGNVTKGGASGGGGGGAGGSGETKRKRDGMDDPGANSSEAQKPRRRGELDAPANVAPYCSICGKAFASWKGVFGHLRAHPRNWRGTYPPPTFNPEGSPESPPAFNPEGSPEREVSPPPVLNPKGSLPPEKQPALKLEASPPQGFKPKGSLPPEKQLALKKQLPPTLLHLAKKTLKEMGGVAVSAEAQGPRPSPSVATASDGAGAGADASSSSSSSRRGGVSVDLNETTQEAAEPSPPKNTGFDLNMPPPEQDDDDDYATA